MRKTFPAALILIVLLLVDTSIITYTSPPPPEPAVCTHFGKWVSLSLAQRLVDESADLGAKYIRFDVWWDEIEPVEGQYNLTALNYYKTIIDYMKSKGISPIVILGTGYPEWVRSYIDSYWECQRLSSSSLLPLLPSASSVNGLRGGLVSRDELLRMLGVKEVDERRVQ